MRQGVAMSLDSYEKALQAMVEIDREAETALAMATMRLIELGDFALALRCNEAQQRMPSRRICVLNAVTDALKKASQR